MRHSLLLYENRDIHHVIINTSRTQLFDMSNTLFIRGVYGLGWLDLAKPVTQPINFFWIGLDLVFEIFLPNSTQTNLVIVGKIRGVHLPHKEA